MCLQSNKNTTNSKIMQIHSPDDTLDIYFFPYNYLALGSELPLIHITEILMKWASYLTPNRTNRHNINSINQGIVYTYRTGVRQQTKYTNIFIRIGVILAVRKFHEWKGQGQNVYVCNIIKKQSHSANWLCTHKKERMWTIGNAFFSSSRGLTSNWSHCT